MRKKRKVIILFALLLIIVLVFAIGLRLATRGKNVPDRQLSPQFPSSDDRDTDDGPADTDTDTTPPASSGAELLFHSGFNLNPNTAFDLIKESGSRDSVHVFEGADTVTGFSWETDLPADYASFTYLTGGESPDKYVTTEIRDGALYQEVRGDAPGSVAKTRNAFNLVEPTITQAYSKYRMKFQENYLDVWPQKNGV